MTDCQNPVYLRLRQIYCCTGAEFCRPNLEAAWKEIARLESQIEPAFRDGYRDGYGNGSSDSVDYEWGTPKHDNVKKRDFCEAWDESEAKRAIQ